MTNICRITKRSRIAHKRHVSAPPEKFKITISIPFFRLFTCSIIFAIIGRRVSTFAYSGGSGTKKDPFLIANEAELEAFRDDVNNGHENLCARLIEDIDISQTGEGWKPIGLTGRSDGVTIDRPFCGIFEGDGHKISGLHVDVDAYMTGYDCAGLFGYIERGTVRNLTVSSAQVRGTSGVTAGIIAGFCSGTIENCAAFGEVSSDYCAGGIVAQMSGGYITGCLNNASVYSHCAGGIVGALSDGAAENCVNIGNVGGARASGIVGVAEADVRISNCCWLIEGSGKPNSGVGGDIKDTATPMNAEQAKMLTEAVIPRSLSASLDLAVIDPNEEGALSHITLSVSPGKSTFGEGGCVRIANLTIEQSDSVISVGSLDKDSGVITISPIMHGSAKVCLTACLHNSIDFAKSIAANTIIYSDKIYTSHDFTFDITVKPILAKSVAILPEDGNEQELIETRREYTYFAHIEPQSAINKTIEWIVTGAASWKTNENGSVSIITGDRDGVVSLIANTQDGSGKCASREYSVIIPNVYSVKVVPESKQITGGIGASAILKASVLPANAQYGTVKWTSSDGSVATVTPYGETVRVTARGAGTATITATTSGVSGECQIEVSEIRAEAVSIHGEALLDMQLGVTAPLNCELSPANSTDTISWESSDPSVATVEADGKVTALSSGVAIITARASGGKEDAITLTIGEPQKNGDENNGSNGKKSITKAHKERQKQLPEEDEMGENTVTEQSKSASEPETN